MQQSPFIFSDERSYRIKRHVIFWLFWWIFQGFLYSFVPFNATAPYFMRLLIAMVESLIYLTMHMLLTYSLIYFVIPHFVIKEKYWKAAVWAAGMFLIAALMSTVLAFTVIPFERKALCLGYPGPPGLSSTSIFLALMAGLRGGITVGGIAAAIKLMKYWYIKEQRNLQLQKENVAAQMQLLKAQVHPHFLFNTLNNIYAYTQDTSPKASALITGLSDMLRYMLYECSQPLVPLIKEIKLLQDYCSLEKVRYDEQLDIQLSIPEKDTGLAIAPLLLLPFVENSFKHGASNQVDHAWISVTISVEGSRMKMKVVNSKPFEEPAQHKPGIGINNVKTRLELIYAGRYELAITDEPEVFIVNLTIELDKQPAPVSIQPAAQKLMAHEQS
jgi:hypothetical protein